MSDSSPTLIRTFKGRLVDIENILPSDIDVYDIAHALANIGRYVGHAPRFYSVAQHSCLVAQKCPAEFQLEGLLHDAAEAYTGDLARPVKHLLNRWAEGKLKKLEEDIERAIAIEFGLTFPWPDCVKQADNELLRIEQIHFWPGTTCSETGEVRDKSKLHPGDKIDPRQPGEAEQTFLAVFRQMKAARNRRSRQSATV